MAEKRKGSSQRNKEGMNPRESGHESWSRNYGEGDIKVVLSRGDWHNWNDVINWLDQSGEQDNELTPGEAIELRDDFRRLKNEGESFTKDPHRIFQMLQQHGGHRR